MLAPFQATAVATMIVPSFWAEKTLRTTHNRRRFTIRRWGWSDVSQHEAETMAHARAGAAMEAILAGETILRREPKTAYNGADGVPIREEILERRNDDVLTRNSYGAICLNTPNVAFVDVDHQRPMAGMLLLTCLAGWAVGWVGVLWTLDAMSVRWLLLGIVVSLVAFVPTSALVASLWLALRGGRAKLARQRVERVLAERGLVDWALYETPLGLRVVLTDHERDPRSAETAALMAAMGADPLYASMCQRQGCFRARVSPKPWRIGVPRLAGPVWPIPAEMAARRAEWVQAYEAAAHGVAACRLIKQSYGLALDETGLEVRTAHPHCQAVRDWHDTLSLADQKTGRMG